MLPALVTRNRGGAPRSREHVPPRRGGCTRQRQRGEELGRFQWRFCLMRAVLQLVETVVHAALGQKIAVRAQLDDASSSTSRISGLNAIARAKARSCFWPTESVEPRSVTTVA